MSNFLDEHKTFLHHMDTTPYIVYVGDILCVKTATGFKFDKILGINSRATDYPDAQELTEAYADLDLQAGDRFVFDATTNPKIIPGYGVVAGNLNRIEWEQETLDLILSQPDVRGLLFVGEEEIIVYLKTKKSAPSVEKFKMGADHGLLKSSQR